MVQCKANMPSSLHIIKHWIEGYINVCSGILPLDLNNSWMTAMIGRSHVSHCLHKHKKEGGGRAILKSMFTGWMDLFRHAAEMWQWAINWWGVDCFLLIFYCPPAFIKKIVCKSEGLKKAQYWFNAGPASVTMDASCSPGISDSLHGICFLQHRPTFLERRTPERWCFRVIRVISSLTMMINDRHRAVI